MHRIHNEPGYPAPVFASIPARRNYYSILLPCPSTFGYLRIGKISGGIDAYAEIHPAPVLLLRANMFNEEHTLHLENILIHDIIINMNGAD